MLWEKESSDGNAMYVDLFKRSWRFGEPVETQYRLHEMSKISYNASGSYYKNDVTATKYREIGNKKFAKKQFLDAMECYNQSLCFAKIGSKAVGLAYANRSTCFLKLNMFKKCLADIELATENQYPAHLMEKLEKRKNDCLKAMETEADQSGIFDPKLDFDANERFACLANVLDVRCNDRFGRHIVATADIDIGKTVMVEKCFIGVTKHDHYKCCNICLKTNQNLIPCRNCTSALFCSDCKNTDLHQIECDMCFGCPAGYKFMDVVRSISLAKNAFENANELMAFVENLLKNTALDMPSNLVDPRSTYAEFFKLCRDLYKYQVYLQQAYLFYRLLLDQDEVSAYFNTNVHKRFLMHLVQHHISMILHGSFNKRAAPIGGINITDTYVNIIAKHINHSCVPNVCHVFKDGCIKCVVIRPIKKNEQLLISQFACDVFESELQRMAVLRSRFVNCECERCMLNSFPSNPRMLLDSDFKLIQKIFKNQTLYFGLYDRERIELMKAKCFSFLQKYGRMNWSKEMGYILDVLSLLLNE